MSRGKSNKLGTCLKYIRSLPDTVVLPKVSRDLSQATKLRILNTDEIDQLVAGYESGKTLHDLASEFGCHHRTVANRLKKRGVKIRVSHTDKETEEEILHLYQSIGTYKGTARRIGVHPAVVKRVILSQLSAKTQ